MSDCSTRAMVPKKKPICGFPSDPCERIVPKRRCGNCGRSFTARKVMSECMCELDGLDDAGRMPTHGDFDEACSRWIEKPAVLEQRLEQLTKVALSMWDNINDFSARAYADEFREKLEALGVIVDECSQTITSAQGKREKCETCGHACYEIHDVICPFPRYEDQEPEEDGRYRQCAVSTACGRYYERPHTLAWRYERLAALAGEIGDWMFMCVETDPGRVIGDDERAEAREFRESLARLGVSVVE